MDAGRVLGGGASGSHLVIFDCDGVLVDSEPLANRVLTEELGSLGLRMSYEEVCARFVGLSLDRCLELAGERLGRPLPEGFRERLQRRTFERFRRELRPVPGISRALERIDCPTCVASSGDHEKMRLTLGLTGLLPRFDGRLFSAVDVARGKPHPDLFLHAAAACGFPPRRCAVVEDSLPGVSAARAAGMRAFAFAPAAHAHADPAALRAARATVFDDMEQLPELLREAGWIGRGVSRC